MAKNVNVRDGISDIMRKAGLHPAMIYAFRKTGLLVGEDSPHTEAERQEWIDACNEWHSRNPTNGGE